MYNGAINKEVSPNQVNKFQKNFKEILDSIDQDIKSKKQRKVYNNQYL